MHPERPFTCTPGCGVKATDTACPRAFHTGLLWDLFRLTLPRVHAAESADTQPGTTALPKHLGRPDFPDTGWDRIKDLFQKEPGQQYSEELTNIWTMGGASALVGLVYGGLPAARHARESFIRRGQGEVYSNRVEAVLAARNAAIRGFVRYGWRWSWRIAAFVTLFNAVSTGLSVYRDKNTISNFCAAGAVTGGLFRINLGLGGLVAGAGLGAALGLPTGAFIIGLQKLSGETMRDKRRRERREQYELRVAEWGNRLKLTDELVVGVSGCVSNPEMDVQRIEELLSQPRNEGSAEPSDDQ